MATGDDMNVAAELAGLRMQMEVGFTRIEGQLNLLVQKNGQFGEDLSDLESALGQVEKRVTALEARRWPVTSVAALSGIVSAAVAALSLLVG